MISTLFAIGKKTSGKTKLKQKVIKTDVEPELQTFDTYKDVGLDEEGLISLQNKLKNSVKQKEEDFGLPHRAKQDPKVIEAALSLSKNDIGVEDFRNLIFKKNQPKNWDFVPRPAGVQEIAAAVTGTAKGVSGPGDKVPKITRGIINVNKTIEEGAFVSSRLDIPAYNKYDVWAVTIHKARNAKKDKGSVLGFGQTAMLTDVTFVAPAQGGFMIATSQIPKNPIARMEGRWKNHTTEEAYEKAQELLTDKNWTQVGYNPFRVSYFYDRATMNPVVAADEVIQVGPFVIAKNVKTAKPTDKRFEVKTKEGNRFNFEEGGKVSTNKQMDRLGFDKGGISVDELLNFVLATEDINLYKDYREGKLDKVIEAHEGSKRFQEQHGRKDVSTVGGITGSNLQQATVGQTVDLVRQRLAEEKTYFNSIIPEEINNQLPQSVKNSAVSLMFNVGKDAFTNSNAYKNLSQGNIEGFYTEAFDPEQGFTKITGADNIKRVDEGLVNRRQQEQQLAEGNWTDPYASIY